MENKTCTKCNVSQPVVGFYKHTQTADGYRSKCKRCVKAESDKWYVENKERKAKTVSKWQSENIVRKRAAEKVWAQQNRPKQRAYVQKWQGENRPSINAYKRAYRSINPAAVARFELARRTAKAQARVRWANPFFISEIYRLSKIRTAMLGSKFVVDHIVPLRHPLVCGLHVEHNLRVIDNHTNAVKGNRWWPDMPEV